LTPARHQPHADGCWHADDLLEPCLAPVAASAFVTGIIPIDGGSLAFSGVTRPTPWSPEDPARY
jgi:hypothetical protein